MQKTQKILVSLFLFVLVAAGIFAVAPRVKAFEVRKQQNLAANETVVGDLFITGDTVSVAGTVTGNLFVAGSVVSVTGHVYGNVFAAGSSVTISNSVGRSVYAAGSTVDISGDVTRDVFVAAGQANIRGTVAEDAFVGSGMALINNVGGNLYAGAGQLTEIGKITKDAFVSAQSTDIDKTKVGGTLSLDLQNKTAQLQQQEENGRKFFAALAGVALFIKFVWFVGMFILGIILLRLFPAFATRLNAELTTNFAKDLGIGILVYLAAPFAIFLLVITLIGIPIAVAIGLLLAAIGLLANIWAGRFVGEQTFKLLKVDNKSDILQLLVGQVIIAILTLIPIIRILVGLSVVASVLGAVLSVQRQNTLAVKK